jgi:hypothetical protein
MRNYSVSQIYFRALVGSTHQRWRKKASKQTGLEAFCVHQLFYHI